MTPEQQRRLTRLARYPTAYELAINTTDGRKLLIAYSQRRTAQCLLANLRERWNTLSPLIDDGEADLSRVGPAYIARGTGEARSARAREPRHDALCHRQGGRVRCKNRGQIRERHAERTPASLTPIDTGTPTGAAFGPLFSLQEPPTSAV
jgi:hypothetical protein